MVIIQVLNMLCCWVEDPNSEAFKLHLPRIHDYLWIAEDGLKMKVGIQLNIFHMVKVIKGCFSSNWTDCNF